MYHTVGPEASVKRKRRSKKDMEKSRNNLNDFGQVNVVELHKDIVAGNVMGHQVISAPKRQSNPQNLVKVQKSMFHIILTVLLMLELYRVIWYRISSRIMGFVTHLKEMHLFW